MGQTGKGRKHHKKSSSAPPRLQKLYGCIWCPNMPSKPEGSFDSHYIHVHPKLKYQRAYNKNRKGKQEDDEEDVGVEADDEEDVGLEADDEDEFGDGGHDPAPTLLH